MGRMLLLGLGGLVVAIVALKLVLAIAGAVFGIAWFLIWKILPLVFLGWLAMWLWRKWKERSAF
jgi:hypothetical protein